MKNTVSVLIFISILFTGLDGRSQNPSWAPYLMERMARAKLNEIQLKLKLDQVTFDGFRPMYLKYEEEISGIEFRKMAKMMKANSDSLSSSEAEMLVMNQLGNAKKIITLREKYYKEFRKVLSPQQIVKLYQIEAGLRNEVIEEIRNRKMKR